MAEPMKMYISQEELKMHNKQGDLWISVQSKVYDVSEWTKHHPGGDLPLLTLAGQDVTNAFVAYHPVTAWQHLDNFFIGYYLKDYSVSEISKDYRKLVAEFSRMGLFKSKAHHLLFSLFLLSLLFVICIYSVLCSDSAWLRLFSGVLLGFFWIQSGWVAHDSSHYQIVTNRRLIQFTEFLFGNCLSGLSVDWWRWAHNAHHIALNSLQLDWDLHLLPFFAVSSKVFLSLKSHLYNKKMNFDSLSRFLVRYQHWTFYPLILFFGRACMLSDSILLFLLSKKKLPNRGLQIVGHLLFWIWYPLLVSCLPNWKERVMFVVACFCVSSIQRIQFTFNHFATNNLYVGPPCANDWLVNQIEGTIDIKCSSWMDWFHGGLQFQIEHHMFPRLPARHLRKISPFVKQFCKRHNLPYNSVSVWKANAMVIDTLWTVAMQAQDLSNLVPPKNLVWEAVNIYG